MDERLTVAVEQVARWLRGSVTNQTGQPLTLRRFFVEVDQPELDLRPLVHFSSDVTPDGALTLTVQDHGFGATAALRGVIRNPILESIFEDQTRSFEVELRAGEARTAHVLRMGELSDIERRLLPQRFSAQWDAANARLPLGQVQVEYATTGCTGTHTDRTHAHYALLRLFATPRSFQLEDEHDELFASPDTTVVPHAVVDPHAGRHSRWYHLDVTLDAHSVHELQIPLHAPASAWCVVRAAFVTADGHVAASPPQRIHLIGDRDAVRWPDARDTRQYRQLRFPLKLEPEDGADASFR